MTVPLYHIADANLISARLYGIDLDLEERRASLERCLAACPTGASAAGGDLHDELDRVEQAFLAVLVHRWPEPDDPVVCALRELAKTGMGHLVRWRDLPGAGSHPVLEPEQKKSR